MGVLGEKLKPRPAANGKAYSLWVLADLAGATAKVCSRPGGAPHHAFCAVPVFFLELFQAFHLMQYSCDAVN